MDPVLSVDVLAKFIGGELEVQNPAEEYTYRGLIESLDLRPATDTTYTVLSIKLAWNAEAIGETTQQGSMPMGWREDTNLEYEANAELPSGEVGGGSVSAVLFHAGRIIIQNPYTNDTVILFPADGNKLSQEKVLWLPDGPKAAYDAKLKRG